MMSAKYFEYYTIILGGAVFSWTRCICFLNVFTLQKLTKCARSKFQLLTTLLQINF